jgi:copper chaperone NosL
MTISTQLAVVISVALLAVGCRAAPAGPPEIVVDRTACSHCGMLISEPLYAAAYRAEGADAQVFDDIGCLRKAAREESTPLTLWFHDADDRSWIERAAPVFVESDAIRTPMGGGVIAYRDRAAAERAAAKYNGRVIASVAELLPARGAL